MSCQPASRAASTRSAIMSIACSSGSSSHSVPWGRRYLTLSSRLGPVTSCLEAAPLGHSRPREMGLSGSPSIWVTCSSLTNTFCPQPTAQYGQTERATRSVCPYCAVGCGQKVFVKDEQVTQIEGDPDSPISRGRLCPKGAASKQLVTG